MANGKGKFSADIGEDVIAAALDSVEQRTRSGESEVLDVEASSGPDGDVAAAGVSAEPAAQALSARLAEAEERVRQLEAQAKLDKDAALRGAADLDNARKRAQRDLQEGVRFANERLLKDFLPVLDNLERALSQGSGTRDWGSLEQGLQMTQKQFEATLARHGARPLTALGQPFDPNLHQAVERVETDEADDHTVIGEFQKGYNFKGKLLRPAMVRVAVKP